MNLSEKLEKIKEIPKDNVVDDVTYNDLKNQGPSILNCLANQVENTKEMKDFRQYPVYSDVRIGDLAYTLFIDITQLDFESFLPIEVQEKWKNQGVYAYFEYVEKPENRMELAQKCREWCENNMKQ